MSLRFSKCPLSQSALSSCSLNLLFCQASPYCAPSAACGDPTLVLVISPSLMDYYVLIALLSSSSLFTIKTLKHSPEIQLTLEA